MSAAPTRWRLLVVDDDEVDRAAIGRALGKAGIAADVDQADGGHAGLGRAREVAYDVVLLDFELPDLGAEDFIHRLRAAGSTAPVLLVTGHEEAHIARALESGEAGAFDFLPKGDLTPERLASRLRSTVRVARAEAAAAAALAEARRAVHLRDQVVAVVSHDLRNPLGAARLAVDQLVDPRLGEAERGPLLAAAGRALARADRLIRDLLEVSRLEGGAMPLSPRPIALAELFAACRHDHAALAEHAGATIELALEGEVPRALVDPERMLQALGNLVGNALEHARGCRIELGAARAGGDAVRVWVKDDGPGIAPDALPHVFDRFYQASHQRRAGAGLGLAIARGIVAQHGGELAVTSAPGRGSEFHFEVAAAPVAPARATLAAQPDDRPVQREQAGGPRGRRQDAELLAAVPAE
jgi:signal transduction histidine kinase